ncbi:MAG: BetI-type transcriptional repressor, C-terminal, partial [Gaiellales bacterium]|nr:BetI-type transcriptional repressor, C-terminal [Gaiellales bacterium]
WIEQIAGLIEEGLEAGSIAAGVDVGDASLRLAAVVDGLGLQILPGVLTRERSAELIVGALELELGVTQTTRSSA